MAAPSKLDTILDNITWVFDKSSGKLTVEAAGLTPDQAKQQIKDLMLELVKDTSSLAGSHPQFANYISGQELQDKINAL